MSVMTKQLLLTRKGELDHSTKLHSIAFDSEEAVQKEVHIGYRKKATLLPTSGSPFAENSPDARQRTEELTKDIDLNLLWSNTCCVYDYGV